MRVLLDEVARDDSPRATSYNSRQKSCGGQPATCPQARARARYPDCARAGLSLSEFNPLSNCALVLALLTLTSSSKCICQQ